MIHLIQRGLMFGNLFAVDSPALVERYNRALQHLIGKTTDLTEFHIDISGFSPEVGDALGDMDYLNPGGCNRQFILLSVKQKTAPLLEMRFSTSRDILRQFIEANEQQLFLLTAGDAVAGELVNSVYSVDRPARLLDMRTVTVEADTTQGTVAQARKLDGLITRFRSEPDGWWDDVLIAQMIGLAKETGDVMRAPIALEVPSFRKDDFWTAHFGGLYIFRDVKVPFVAAVGEVPEGLSLPVVPFSDPSKLAKRLVKNGLIEPIVQARGPEAAGILRQKLDFMLVAVAGRAGAELGAVGPREMRALARRYAADLPEEFHALQSLVAWAEGQGDWPHVDSENPAYFYTLRAAPGPQRDLVNMLLAELTPLDVRALFICHKPAFYAAYASWPDAMKLWVADFLASAYVPDKAGVRDRLFGGTAPAPVAPAPVAPAPEDVVELVGPWGAIRRR